MYATLAKPSSISVSLSNSTFVTTGEQVKKSDKYTKEQLNSLFSNLDEVEI